MQYDPESMDVDRGLVPQMRNLDGNFVDDDDLQAALARSRKAKLHRTKKISPEEVARQSESLSYLMLSVLIP